MDLPPEVDRKLYDGVVAIVMRHTGQKEDKIKPESRLYHELGADGTDAYELLMQLKDQFVFDKHFGPEAGWNPIVWVHWILFEREKLNKRGTAVRKVPISVMDLYDAAVAKKFPNLSSRQAE